MSKRPEKKKAPAAAAARGVRLGAGPSGTLLVRATRQCFVDNGRRRVGDVFRVRQADFSAQCMEPVDGHAPERVTGPNAAIRREHDAILGGTVAGTSGGADAGGDDAPDPIGDA